MGKNFRHIVRDINKWRVTPNQIVYRTVDGYKGIDDRILQLHTYNHWCNITFKDILKILAHLFENEDKVYPVHEGRQGRHYLFDAITKLYNGDTVEHILNEYGDRHRDI